MSSPKHRQRATLLRSAFLGGPLVAVYLNGHPAPVEAPDLDALLLTHVAGPLAPEVQVEVRSKNAAGAHLGRFRVGAYVQGADDLARWVCIDLDGGGEHRRPLADPLATALAVLGKCSDLSLPCYLEKSGGGKGWHVWLFLGAPAPVETARVLGLGLCPTDAALEGSGIADPLLGQGIEVFPKSFAPREVGNMVWLPWWAGAKPGGARFYDIESLMPTDEPEGSGFSTLTPELISGALGKLPPVDHWKARPDPNRAPKGKGKKKGAVPSASAPASPEGGEVSPEELDRSPLKEWRLQVLAKVDLEEVYSPHLVDLPGAGSSGWLRCRDPFNPPDVEPSAGVSDGSGEAERGRFHNFHTEETLSVFDFLVKVGRVKTLGASLRLVSKLTAIPLPSSQVEVNDPRPMVIVTGLQLDAVVTAAWGHLVAAQKTDPRLFLRSGKLSAVAENDPELLPIISRLDLDGLRHYLSRAARWYRLQNDELQACYPPREVAADMLAMPRADLIPPLDAVVASPVFDAEGKLCSAPGYNPTVRAWYAPRGLDTTPPPQAPTPEELAAAKALLWEELLTDFRFATPSDKTHALGVLILFFVRPLIFGPTPLHTFESPTEGSGKGLLLQLIALIATGLDLEIGTLPPDEEELRKRITSELLSGAPIVAFDNANTISRKSIDSGLLEAALTSGWWRDRRMSTQEVISAKNRAVWTMTGVNLLFSKGIRRRRVRVRIDPACEDPWRRGEEAFKHQQPAWTREHRPELVGAVLTLVAHWLAIGRPRASRQLGSYPDWSNVVGGILESAGFEGWLTFLTDDDEQVTEENRGEWHALAERWFKTYGSKPVKPAEVNKVAEGNVLDDEEPLLTQYRKGESPRGQVATFGKELLRRRGQIFGGYRLSAKPDPKNKGTLYSLELLPQASTAAGGAPLVTQGALAREPGCDDGDDLAGFDDQKSDDAYTDLPGFEPGDSAKPLKPVSHLATFRHAKARND